MTKRMYPATVTKDDRNTPWLVAEGTEICDRCKRRILRGVPIVLNSKSKPRHRRDCQP